MKSIFGQITAADLKKGISWIRLNKKDKRIAVALAKTPITVSKLTDIK